MLLEAAGELQAYCQKLPSKAAEAMHINGANPGPLAAALVAGAAAAYGAGCVLDHINNKRHRNLNAKMAAEPDRDLLQHDETSDSLTADEDRDQEIALREAEAPLDMPLCSALPATVPQPTEQQDAETQSNDLPTVMGPQESPSGPVLLSIVAPAIVSAPISKPVTKTSIRVPASTPGSNEFKPATTTISAAQAFASSPVSASQKHVTCASSPGAVNAASMALSAKSMSSVPKVAVGNLEAKAPQLHLVVKQHITSISGTSVTIPGATQEQRVEKVAVVTDPTKHCTECGN